MKKIMMLALGLSLLSGSVVFAQDKVDTSKTSKDKKGKKGGKKGKKSSGGTTTPPPK